MSGKPTTKMRINMRSPVRPPLIPYLSRLSSLTSAVWQIFAVFGMASLLPLSLPLLLGGLSASTLFALYALHLRRRPSMRNLQGPARPSFLFGAVLTQFSTYGMYITLLNRAYSRASAPSASRGARIRMDYQIRQRIKNYGMLWRSFIIFIWLYVLNYQI
jgi:hypothetical protein